MKEYHKIPTVYLRDPNNRYKTLLDGVWSKPEFEFLKNARWEFTEKLDGMNIRIERNEAGVDWAGRTERAEIPKNLQERLLQIGDRMLFGDAITGPIVLYGEGFGAGIQKGGDYGEQDFALFDAMAGEDTWLHREDVIAIAKGLEIPYAGTLCWGTLEQAVGMAEAGFDSMFGSAKAEGLVMRPPVDLFNRFGERVIAKIKTKDFPAAITGPISV